MLFQRNDTLSNGASSDEISPPDPQFDWETGFYLVVQLIGGIGLSALLITMLWPMSKKT